MSFRAFIAADIGPTPKLYELNGRLEASGAPLKLVDLENIHMTLKFLGDTDEALIEDIAAIMTRSVEGIEPFTLKLRGAGVFPNPNYIKVFWVGLENAGSLITMAKKLDSELTKLGFKREKRGLHPHITMARVKGPRNKNRLQNLLKEYNDVIFGTQKVECIKLKKSVLAREGPTYTTVKEVRL